MWMLRLRYLAERLPAVRYVTLLIASLILLPPEVQSSSTAVQRLNDIAASVERESAKLKGLMVQQSRLEKQIAELKAHNEELEREELRMLEELGTLRSQEEATLEALEAVKSKLKETEILSLQRIRAAYKWRKVNENEVLLTMLSAGEPYRNSLFLKKIREGDLALMNQLASLRRLHEGRKQELSNIVTEKQRVYEAVQRQRELLEASVLKQQNLSIEYQKQRTFIEKVLRLLKSEALRLEVIVKSIFRELARNSRKERVAATGLPHFEPFQGAGLEGRKGNLALPADGRIVKTFGKGEASGFEDYVMSNGVELETEPGAEVRSVAAGRVVHVGTMAGYGMVVIVDHGSRMFSLLGNLANSTVQAGDVVAEQGVIGHSGAGRRPENGGVYFEIRSGTKPINPLDYVSASVGPKT